MNSSRHTRILELSLHAQGRSGPVAARFLYVLEERSEENRFEAHVGQRMRLE